MTPPKLSWHRGRGWVALAFAVAALGLAVAATLARTRQPPMHATLTGGPAGTTRDLVARTLAEAAGEHGLHVHVVDTAATEDAIDQVDRGTLDFAMVAGASPIERRIGLREVAPLYVEALHLLVKPDLVDPVSASLTALRGRTVDIGPEGSTTAALATAVLGFAQVGIAGGPNDVVARRIGVEALETLTARGDAGALPDAVFHLGTVPSKVARALVRNDGFRLAPIPFAHAFRLGALLDAATRGTPPPIEGRYVGETVIPPFTYEIEPPVPPEPLRTVGAPLVLVAGAHVPAQVVLVMLEAVYGPRFATLTHPPLDRSALALPPRLRRHAGAEEFLRRDQPFITGSTVDALSNTFSILGALGGSGIFLWQWRRQRRQAQRDETFGAYLLKVADIERRALELELAATLHLAPLAALQRELLELNTEALQRFAEGELGDQASLSDLAVLINAAREHIGGLILHVRDNIEEQAGDDRGALQAAWADAAKEPTE